VHIHKVLQPTFINDNVADFAIVGFSGRATAKASIKLHRNDQWKMPPESDAGKFHLAVVVGTIHYLF